MYNNNHIMPNNDSIAFQKLFYYQDFNKECRKSRIFNASSQNKKICVQLCIIPDISKKKKIRIILLYCITII